MILEVLQGEENNHRAFLEGNTWHDAISYLEKQAFHSIQVGAMGTFFSNKPIGSILHGLRKLIWYYGRIDYADSVRVFFLSSFLATRRIWESSKQHWKT